MNIAYNMDCLDAMRQMPDKCFDLSVVDPPFGIGNFVQISGNKRGEKVRWNDEIPSKEYFEQLKRVSKEQIIFGANYYGKINCCSGCGGCIIWIKHVPFESHLSGAEIASYSRDKRIVVADIPWSNFHRTHSDEATIHPCQKPVKLYRWIFQHYTKPNDKILDTHLGSGSSRIAAYNARLDFIGFEIDKDYFEKQEERFAAHIAQSSLFVDGGIINDNANAKP